MHILRHPALRVLLINFSIYHPSLQGVYSEQYDFSDLAEGGMVSNNDKKGQIPQDL